MSQARWGFTVRPSLKMRGNSKQSGGGGGQDDPAGQGQSRHPGFTHPPDLSCQHSDLSETEEK